LEEDVMKRKIGFYIFVGIFSVSMALVFCAGYFRKSITTDSGRFYLELAAGSGISRASEAVYDVQNEDLLKNAGQPGRISISAGYGSGITNSSGRPLWISIGATGYAGTAKVMSTDPSFNEETGHRMKPLMPGDNLDLNLSLDLPEKALESYLVSKGKIEIYDYKADLKLGEIPIKIINSKPRKSCCTADCDCK
jgi:hypothetical protein